MSIKSSGAKLYAKIISKKIDKWSSKPEEAQQEVFDDLIRRAKHTVFGIDHDFARIESIADFTQNVPVRSYEDLKPYVRQMVQGKPNILWPGKPLYFAKTSGTTSGAKFIPITKESISNHIEGARNAILNYVNETGNCDFIEGKMIFLQGNPKLTETNGIPTGRLSGISAHFVPAYLQKNRMPSWETNCIEDWEEKLDAIIEETLPENMTVISGIPSWVQMYFENIIAKVNRPIKDVFPNFNLFIYGGVNFEPYKKKFDKLIGKKIPSIELFPASEGFFAFQDRQDKEGLLLRLKAGIFYEFIKASEFYQEHPKSYTIGEVEKNIDYVMIISTNAGLWRYNLGDTVRFVSVKPYRLIVSGRLKHFISAFGEHVIGTEVEKSMQKAMSDAGGRINEFTVAPQVNPDKGLPYHEWFIEFDEQPADMDRFIDVLDQALCQQNSYYDDLIKGKILRKLVISKISKNGFQKYMQSIGKLGGQNKVPRLANNREIADKLKKYKVDE